MCVETAARVSVRGLTKRYGSVEAVAGIDFDVKPGEIFGLLGPNGAGKTTTLECVLGLRAPDAGSILVNGVDVAHAGAQAKERIGALLQPAALQDQITPRQALALFASFYDQPAGVDATLARFGLSDKADRSFVSLSMGEKQRLFLALGFINEPLLVILDEPTANLDPKSRRELHDLIRGMRTAGRAVLLSSHYLDEAQSLCDRVAILDQGRIVAMASPAKLIDSAKSRPKIQLRATRPVEQAALQALPGVAEVEGGGSAWTLVTAELHRTLVAVVSLLDREQNPLVELSIDRPTLEDVFIELTGRRWSAVSERGAE